MLVSIFSSHNHISISSSSGSGQRWGLGIIHAANPGSIYTYIHLVYYQPKLESPPPKEVIVALIQGLFFYDYDEFATIIQA